VVRSEIMPDEEEDEEEQQQLRRSGDSTYGAKSGVEFVRIVRTRANRRRKQR
jgi:hypothetical protein